MLHTHTNQPRTATKRSSEIEAVFGRQRAKVFGVCTPFAAALQPFQEEKKIETYTLLVVAGVNDVVESSVVYV